MSRDRDQGAVSTRLAGQALEALGELLRGFQAAGEPGRGAPPGAAVQGDPDHVHGGLVAVVLRLVFLLHAEERGLVSASPIYVRDHSVTGLFEELRSAAARSPDAMDRRRGAWSRLRALFRLIHGGARDGELRLPPRRGRLFDPEAWGFLEGGTDGIADGAILRVLEKLLLVDGERLSYRALDVELIGSVHEGLMGFRLERAAEASIGVGKQHVVIGLETLLGRRGAARAGQLAEAADVELSGRAAAALAAATTVDELVAVLGRRISPLTPRPVPRGGLYLQPTDERRRSGSHYTPRELTGPIVRTALRPVLEDLGPSPRPEQILALRVCDPAMGSGAFLIEACRQLAAPLARAYEVHGRPADVPPGEDLLLHARRQIARRCLYGVDRNPLAVELGKLSLWLETLARDHAFTFLDASIRHGDSLVGLSRAQIARCSRAPGPEVPAIRACLDEAAGAAGPRGAGEARSRARRIGDAIVACGFAEDGARAREEARRRAEAAALSLLERGEVPGELERLADRLRSAGQAVPCFHWELEFPEVFAQGGFSCVVGNPPFLGGTRISTALGMRYFRWLVEEYPPCEHLCDLAAYFFRRAFALLRPGGTLGLIATNTIAQGDTREGGLRTILREGGQIYSATRRLRWPGPTAVSVVVSVVHIAKGRARHPVLLDGEPVDRISAFLVRGAGDDSPARLPGNPYFSLGSKIYSQGFLFADGDPDCTPLAERARILAAHPQLADRIRPYIGGSEILSHPRQRYHRHVILLSDVATEEELAALGELAEIVRRKVKPGRDALGDNPNNVPLRRRWWAFQAHRPELYRRLAGMARVLATSQVNPHLAFALMPADWIYSQKAILFCDESFAGFAVVQSRIHELWARSFSSTSMELASYTPSDCYETFPFPEDHPANAALDAIGRAYHEARAALMAREEIGLTELYNRFHDPARTDGGIAELRRLHDRMDRAVLDAYGWRDLRPACAFLLDGRRWRHRWPDEVRDELLARLLELNARRAGARG